jgi:ribosome-associated translation inhibitor RaiA
MELNYEDLNYEFYTKDLLQTSALRQFADHAVKEIKSTYGWDTEVRISIEPEAKDKHLFSVSMSVYGLGTPVVIEKDGKHVMSLLRKVRKSIMRQIHRMHERRIHLRRPRNYREQWAS